MLFKDKDLNRRNKFDQERNMEELAKAITDNKTNPGALKDFLLGDYDNNNNNQKHNPEHTLCTYQNGGSGRITEKRICRCMHYYNDNNYPQELKKICESCDYPAKLINTSKFEILDYEVPMRTVTKKVGGIDLLLRDKSDDKVYGVELKPPYSKETFVRMVGEILTYSELLDYQVEVKNTGKVCKFEPAICFFEKDSLEPNSTKNSIQWNDYKKWSKDHNFKTIINSVKVFYIRVNGNTFDIY